MTIVDVACSMQISESGLVQRSAAAWHCFKFIVVCSLSQWLCHDDITINILFSVVAVAVVVVVVCGGCTVLRFDCMFHKVCNLLFANYTQIYVS